MGPLELALAQVAFLLRIWKWVPGPTLAKWVYNCFARNFGWPVLPG